MSEHCWHMQAMRVVKDEADIFGPAEIRESQSCCWCPARQVLVWLSRKGPAAGHGTVVSVPNRELWTKSLEAGEATCKRPS